MGHSPADASERVVEAAACCTGQCRARTLLDVRHRPVAPASPYSWGAQDAQGRRFWVSCSAGQPRIRLVERELHFHADRGGLADVLAGRIDVSYFVQRMRGFWYRRPSPYGDSRGLFWLVPEARLDAMLQRFADAFERDRARACASLLDEVVENHPVAEGRAWIERTPANSQAAPWLLSMFPQAAFVNIVRSGLDVASSLTEQRWAPDDINDCLLWWADTISAGRALAAPDAAGNLDHRAPRGTRPR